jgi:hypothetical protein
VAGLLLFVESQASDVADRSTLQGFLSKSDYDQFITPNVNRMKHGNELGASPFTVVDDKPMLQSSTQVVNNSNDPISLSIFSIGLVSFVTMLGLSLWRALQPATIPANTVSALGGQVMEMKAQDSNANSGRVGWGQQSSKSLHPRTLCYAGGDYSQELGAQAPAGFWDPLGLSDGISPEQFDRYREVEQKHGRIAMIATIGYVVPEKIGTFGNLKLSFSEDVKFEDVPNGVQALFKIPTLGLLQILLLIGILETQFPNVNGDYGTGYFGRSLEEPEKSRKLAIELSNGRLAMLAIMGLLAQDVVTQGQPLAVSAKFPEGTFQSL